MRFGPLTTAVSVVVSSVLCFNIGYNKGHDDATNEFKPKMHELQSKTEGLQNDLFNLQELIKLKDSQLAKPVTVSASKMNYSPGTKVGKFVISAYSPYDDRNYINSDGDPSNTATGTTPKPGTFAVDPRVIPYGSKVTIIYPNGTVEHGTAEDTGGAIKRNRIDVFRWTFDAAMQFGKQEAIVIWNTQQ